MEPDFGAAAAGGGHPAVSVTVFALQLTDDVSASR